MGWIGGLLSRLVFQGSVMNRRSSYEAERGLRSLTVVGADIGIAGHCARWARPVIKGRDIRDFRPHTVSSEEQSVEDAPLPSIFLTETARYQAGSPGAELFSRQCPSR
jgi:hypothetical protein